MTSQKGEGPAPEGPDADLDRSTQGLGSRSARAAVLGVAGQFGKLAVNMLSLVVLARIIAPEDYGLIAMVVSVVGVAELVRDMGLSSAAIRATSLSRQQRDNLWWLNTVLGLASAAAVCGLAPVLAWFYGDSRLVPLTLAFSSMFLLGGMATQFSADLVRKLQFGRQSLVNVSTAALAFGAAYLAATAGWGYWALAVQQILGSVLSLILLGLAAGWLPRRYRRGVPMRGFFRFGLPVFGSQVLTYASGNVDQMLVGRFFGTAMLGQYTRGIQLVRMPLNQVRGPLSQAALSTLARLREDKDAYARYLSKAQLGMLYPLAIASTVVAAVAADLVPFALGPGWGHVAGFVTIFAVGDMISSLAAAGGWLYMSEGKGGALLRYTMISAAVRLAMFGGAVPFGIHAVAAVYILAPLLLWPFSLWYCGRATGRETMPLFTGSLRVFLVAGTAFLGGFSVSWAWEDAGLTRFLVTVAAYVAVLSLTLVVPQVRRDLALVISMFRALLRRDRR